MDKKDYFSDDCIVENDLFRGLKNNLLCPLCNKIFKDPMICFTCGKTFCQKCIGDKCPNNCKINKFSKDQTKEVLLTRIKYKCKNCSEEIFQNEIPAHLESNCEYKEDKSIHKSLSEIFTTKKELTKIPLQELSKYNDDEINYFTSKF